MRLLYVHLIVSKYSHISSMYEFIYYCKTFSFDVQQMNQMLCWVLQYVFKVKVVCVNYILN